MEQATATPVRVLVAGMPPMLMDMIEGIVAPEGDMTIVARATAEADIIPAMAAANADVVILRSRDNRDAEANDYASLLSARPGLRVLAVSGSGRSFVLHEMRPRRLSLGTISAGRLVAAIRGAPLGGAGP